MRNLRDRVHTMKTKYEYPLVAVDWTDAMGFQDWKPLEEAIRQKPAKCTTVGFLLNDNPEFVTIAQTISHSEAKVDIVDGVLCIPRPGIQKVTYL